MGSAPGHGCAVRGPLSGRGGFTFRASRQGWIDERRVALEILTSIKRAGADMILTYFAADAARWLK